MISWSITIFSKCFTSYTDYNCGLGGKVGKKTKINLRKPKKALKNLKNRYIK